MLKKCGFILRSAAVPGPVASHHLCQTRISELIVDVQINSIADKRIYGALLQIHYPNVKTPILSSLPILLEELYKWLQSLAAWNHYNAVCPHLC